MLQDVLTIDQRKMVIERTVQTLQNNSDSIKAQKGLQFLCSCGDKKCFGEIYGRHFSGNPGRWAIGLIQHYAPPGLRMSKKGETDEESVARILGFKGKLPVFSEVLDTERLEETIEILNKINELNAQNNEPLREIDIQTVVTHTRSNIAEYGRRKTLETSETIFE